LPTLINLLIKVFKQKLCSLDKELDKITSNYKYKSHKINDSVIVINNENGQATIVNSNPTTSLTYNSTTTPIATTKPKLKDERKKVIYDSELDEEEEDDYDSNDDPNYVGEKRCKKSKETSRRSNTKFLRRSDVKKSNNNKDKDEGSNSNNKETTSNKDREDSLNVNVNKLSNVQKESFPQANNDLIKPVTNGNVLNVSVSATSFLPLVSVSAGTTTVLTSKHLQNKAVDLFKVLRRNEDGKEEIIKDLINEVKDNNHLKMLENMGIDISCYK